MCCVKRFLTLRASRFQPLPFSRFLLAYGRIQTLLGPNYEPPRIPLSLVTDRRSLTLCAPLQFSKTKTVWLVLTFNWKSHAAARIVSSESRRSLECPERPSSSCYPESHHDLNLQSRTNNWCTLIQPGTLKGGSSIGADVRVYPHRIHWTQITIASRCLMTIDD